MVLVLMNTTYADTIVFVLCQSITVVVSLLNSWRHDKSGQSHHVHLLAANPLALTRFASLAEASMLNALHSRDEPGRSVMTSNC
jgi:hypothetical protein